MLVPESIYIDLAIDRNPIVLTLEQSVQDALRCMNQSFNSNKLGSGDRISLASRAGCVFVSDEGKLKGLLTQWNVFQLIEEKIDLQNLKLREVIIPPEQTVKREELRDLDTLNSLLVNSRSGYLPIVDEHEILLGFTSPEKILLAKQQQAKDNLKQTELQKHSILTAIPELMYRVSAEGIYLECFPSSYVDDLFTKGIDPIGKHLSDVLPESLAQRKLEVLQQVIATGELQSFEQKWTVDGKTQYEELQFVKINDQEVLTIIRDVRDRKSVV